MTYEIINNNLIMYERFCSFNILAEQVFLNVIFTNESPEKKNITDKKLASNNKFIIYSFVFKKEVVQYNRLN